MEGLRGLAAAIVLHCHLFFPGPDVDPRYSPSAAGYLFQVGQGAVLLFFVISGYVIGLGNHQPFSRNGAVNYLQRRWVRIYPLYLIAVLLSVIAVRESSAWPVIANLFLLQTPLSFFGETVPLLKGNSNLWSLQYEAVYYLLFLWLWARKTPVHWPILGCTVLVGAAWWIPGGLPPLLTNYAAGWAFWLAGLWLARSPTTMTPARLPWPSLLLLFCATWNMKPAAILMDRLGHAAPVEGWINISVLEFLPVCVALLMAVTARRPHGWRGLVGAAFAVPGLLCCWQIKRGNFLHDYLAPYECLVIAAVLLAWWRPSGTAWVKLAPFGAISYGVYVFQRPVQWWVRDQAWLPAGTAASYLLRAALILSLTVLLAWLAEKKLQPWLRLKLRPAHAT